MSPTGIGVDLESVARFRDKKLARNQRFLARVFSEREIAYCREFADPAPNFAARFCAKEALVKAASSVTALFISDAEIVKSPNGAPELKLRSERPEARAFFARHEVSVSLSHTDEWAVAFVWVQKKKGRRK